MKGKLILEDGSVFTGNLLNNIKATGEVVFNTGMTGYQEILTHYYTGVTIGPYVPG